MIFLGEYYTNSTLRYRVNFHDETGTLEDPTNPTSRIEKPNGDFLDLNTPTKINNKTGYYGGSIDLTGYLPGIYYIRFYGEVTTSKIIAKSLWFSVGENIGYTVPGNDFKYRVQFHDDTSTIADPVSAEAFIEYPDGTFVDLSAPTKIDSKTGYYGGTVTTNGLANGVYIIRVKGEVATSKHTAYEFYYFLGNAYRSTRGINYY